MENTIELLRSVINNEYCKKNMNLSNVKGYLGELLVWQKLQDEGVDVKPVGNQSGYDLEISKKKIFIDVKLSLIKIEVKHCPPYWGWALKHANKKKEISCSHFICVALGDDLFPVKYYVIHRNKLDEFPKSGIKQFSKVEKGFSILHDSKDIAQVQKEDLREYFNNCSNLLLKGSAIEVPSSKRLIDYL